MTMSAPTAAHQATARAVAPASGKGRLDTYVGTARPGMLGHQTERHPTIAPHWIADTMTTRTAALVTISLMFILLTVVVIAVIFGGDMSERTGGLVGTALGTFGVALTGLLLFLRIDTVDSKADVAATHAEIAATRAAVVEQKVEGVHHDLLNGGLRENVIRAIRETETDPEIMQQRANNATRGVQQDRHEKAGRDTVTITRAELDALLRRAGAQDGRE